MEASIHPVSFIAEAVGAFPYPKTLWFVFLHFTGVGAALIIDESVNFCRLAKSHFVFKILK
jgi:hypothetical protein